MCQIIVKLLCFMYIYINIFWINSIFRFLKGEVFSTADNRKEEGQMLFEVKAEKASLMEKLDVLEE